MKVSLFKTDNLYHIKIGTNLSYERYILETNFEVKVYKLLCWLGFGDDFSIPGPRYYDRRPWFSKLIYNWRNLIYGYKSRYERRSCRM